MERPPPLGLRWLCDLGQVIWRPDFSVRALWQEHMLLAVPAPGQRGRESRQGLRTHQPAPSGTRREEVVPEDMYVYLLLIQRLLLHRWAGPTLRLREDQWLPQGTQQLSHTWNSHLVTVLMPQLLSPPHPPCLAPLSSIQTGLRRPWALTYLLSLGRHLPSAVGREEGQDGQSRGR